MDCNNLKDEEFDSILSEIVKENASNLLTIPGAYEIFSEYFNNDVLERWEQRQENEE